MLTDRRFFSLNHYQMQNYIRQTSPLTLTPIDSADISVVVQGPVFTNPHELAPDGITLQVLNAVRQYLPQATIILATWENQPTADLPADVILTLTDPGTTNFYAKGAKAGNYFNNANRLIYSTQQGLAAVKTRFVMKIRSDLLLFHPLVSGFFGQFDEYDDAFHVLKSRILAYPIFSLKFERGKNQLHKRIKQPRPFHVSDWAYFGLTEDVKELFNCPQQPEPETSRWFEHRPKPVNDLFRDRLWRYSPEQYITSNLAQRKLGITLAHASEDNPAIVEASERFIANNFVILDQYQWGLWSLKLEHYQDSVYRFVKDGLYSFAIWQADYHKYAKTAATH